MEIPDEPAAAVETIAKELAAGNGGVLWQAMPATYQTDVNAIAQLAGSKVDAEVYDQSFGLLGRIADVADKQKEFILNTELGGAQPEEQIAKIEAAWPSIIGFVRTITDSPIATSSGLQSFDGQAFFSGTVSELLGHSEAFSSLNDEAMSLSSLRDVSVKALESGENAATLEMTAPDGTVETEEFTKVDGRWVPTDMAVGWQETIAGARGQLEAITPEQIAQQKPQVMQVVNMLDGVLTQIEAAETQEQFDQALQGAMMPLMGLMMMQQNMGGGQPSAPAMPMPTQP
ncbi:MAG: hypothetical protein GVY36_00290 [Verrucomicrobia bacterium]|nr:hypothetical protein [Verrucomicrobiota bacterium]